MKRFWEKVDKTGDCWEWIAGKFASGYGQFTVDGHPVRAHRFVLELEGLDIPSGMCVLHTCDNPACVNPDHLWLGTNKENTADMIAKGRSTLHLGRSKPGEVRHTKVTEEDVKEIRAAYASGETQASISKRYPINDRSISNIVNGITWRDVA